ncbi:MAG TPA: primosomal protein N' [Chitinivibrionales bacterium]|nr:primosomal protein N' [Chitinivibrionales bacterium]
MSSPQYKVACVAFPMAVSGVYDYDIPEPLRQDITPGMPVFVELRNRRVWGVAVRLKESSAHSHLKPVLEIKKDAWSDADSSLIKLYEWIAAYYQCDLGRVFRPFVRKNYVTVRPKTVTVYRVASAAPERITQKQKEALSRLAAFQGDLTGNVCQQEVKVAPHLLAALCKAGALVKEKRTVLREAPELAGGLGGYNIVLTQEQQDAVEAVSRGFSEKSGPFMLHGITGSGKTHVYIELARRALAAGRGVIILVPEISLTPQTIARFRQALGDVIAVIHSRMSDGERRDSLNALVTGRKRLAIGVRSAILAPVAGLGLIIVDEEHDQSYKQSDLDPRYNARDVAMMRARLQNAVAVLGSATPSLESYHNAQTGKYRLLTLQNRFGGAVLPAVTVVDMREEHRDNNWTLLSRHLRARIGRALDGGRQIILLLNRRGFSTFLVCKDCGHTYTCPQCSVNLIYHKSDFRLKCHQCGREEPAPSACPVCKGEQIKFKGTGIQRAEEYLFSQFPQARIIRMDQDTTAVKGGHVSIIGRFEKREADILLGTQMVAKGLDFPGVALVGVLQADIGLHFPDFRAAEKTFQLLSQVAGRAGRADRLGEVVVQTYFPDEPAVCAARDHDYLEFYNREIAAREALGYPPFGKLVRIVLSGREPNAVRTLLLSAAAAAQKTLKNPAAVLGPSPAVIAKLKNEFRYNLLLKAASPKALQEAVLAVRQGIRVPKSMRLAIDVDPVNMM